MDHCYEEKYRNIWLRSIEEKDLESLRLWRNESKNTEFLRKIPYITLDGQRKWYYEYLKNASEAFFAIQEIDQLNRLVGSLSLYNIHEKDCTFGKILIGDSEAHGRKVGTNATIAAIRIAFYQLGKDIVQLYVHKDNQKALKVYKEAGFKVIEEHKNEHREAEYTMIVQKGDWRNE